MTSAKRPSDCSSERVFFEMRPLRKTVLSFILGLNGSRSNYLLVII